MISSADNPRVKLVRALRDQRKTRVAERAFIAEGASLVRDLIAAGMTARFVMLNEARAGWGGSLTLERVLVNDAVMKSCSDETTPPGVIGVFEQPANPQPAPGLALDLVLDAVSDPGNLGACLRVAAGVGCTRVWLAPGCVDAWNPKVVRGGMGAHARLCLQDAGWDALPAHLHGRSLFAAAAQASDDYAVANWRAPAALIIGSEAHGLSEGALALNPSMLRIPLANGLESLNAAVATGVMLFEAARQRRT